MEKKFYPDNFEQFLRETTDNFRMYPSKRVWHSIYNDLHPSRRWPSLAIWLLLISSITFIGVTNKNEIVPSHNNLKVMAQSKPVTNMIVSNVKTIHSSDLDLVLRKQDISSTGVNSAPIGNNVNINIKNILSAKDQSNSSDFAPANKEKSTNSSAKKIVNDEVTEFEDHHLTTETIGSSERKIMKEEILTTLPETNIAEPVNENSSAKEKIIIKDKPNTSEKEWIEDYAFHNKPEMSKWKSRMSYQFYVTPSIGYRKLTTNTLSDQVAQPSFTASRGTVEDYKTALSQIAAINMELGTNLLYSVSNRIGIKAGIQFNYTNYSINAFELKHPTMTTLLLNDVNTGFTELEARPSTLANIKGVYTTKLNNNTYQISLPVGANFKLAGKDNLKLFAGATIQPTYITGGHAYLISSDLKNYVTDHSMIRSFNMNAGIETFVTYKTKSGITVNAGPQLRYQLMSTMSNVYTYNEKLYNLGIKIGIITRF